MIDLSFEIIVIFVTLVCMLLVIKRNIIGAIVYLVVHIYYFGMNLYQMLIGKITMEYISAFISFIGIILPIAVLLELLFDKNSKKHPKDNKTDWYYNSEDYDRKYDDRADKNNYRTL